MRIIRLAKEKPKPSAKIRKLEDGGYIVSVAIEQDGYMECDSLFIPSDVELDLDDLES